MALGIDMVIRFILDNPEFDTVCDFNGFESFVAKYQSLSVQKTKVNQYRLTKRQLLQNLQGKCALASENDDDMERLVNHSLGCETPIQPLANSSSSSNAICTYGIPDKRSEWLAKQNFFDVTNKIEFPIMPYLINFPDEPWTPLTSSWTKRIDGEALNAVYRKHGSDKAYQIAFMRNGELIPSYVVIQCNPVERRNAQRKMEHIVMERFRVSNIYDAKIMLDLLVKILETQGKSTYLTIDKVSTSVNDMLNITESEVYGEKLEDELLRQLDFRNIDSTYTYVMKPAEALCDFDLLPPEIGIQNRIRPAKKFTRPSEGRTRMQQYDEEKNEEGCENLNDEEVEKVLRYHEDPDLMEYLRFCGDKFEKFYENEGNDCGEDPSLYGDDCGEDPSLYNDRSGNTYCLRWIKYLSKRICYI